MAMDTTNSTETSAPSRNRNLLGVARCYLGSWPALLVLIAIALIVGVGFGWNWFVAIGLAPVLLTALPCLVMCGLGLCIACSSKMRSKS